MLLPCGAERCMITLHLPPFLGTTPLLSSAGLGVACSCNVLKCDLSGFLSAILCQSPLDDIELKLGLGRYGEYVDQSSQWTLHCQLHQVAMQQRPCQSSSLTLSQILSVVEVNELAGAHSPVAARKGHALAECRARQPAFQ